MRGRKPMLGDRRWLRLVYVEMRRRKGETLREIAEAVGVSHEQVRLDFLRLDACPPGTRVYTSEPIRLMDGTRIHSGTPGQVLSADYYAGHRVRFDEQVVQVHISEIEPQR